MYRAPLADINFVLNHVVGLEDIAGLEGFGHADPATVAGVLEEAARFFQEVIAPLNRIGDTTGTILNGDGTITTPPGFKQAYKKYVEAGWAGAHDAEEYGGGGFPYTVGIVIQEMFEAANMGLALCPLLTQAAIKSLIRHGSDEQRATYLQKLITGEWSGTMVLTEPHAGSEVGALTTKAVGQPDGTYRIFGQKIFITWGDQDLTDNIIQMVLARTPGAAPGTKGISLFVVPKFIVNADGSLGERNDYRILSIEHKLGIHASPTCVISFGDEGSGAIGYLVGEEQEGMKYMFTMMNTARIGVALEGLAIGEAAYQKALEYAHQRQQGQPPGRQGPTMVPIVEHLDVRRMLATMRAYNEAMRCLLYTAAAAADQEGHSADPETRKAASERLSLLTPVAKAWCTDRGVEIASLGIQVHGGVGYIEETGAAQLYRDARIAPIYEGTNGIQAIDLVMRKLPLGNGSVMESLLAEMVTTAAESFDHLIADRLGHAVEILTSTTTHLGTKLAEGDYDDALAGATPYLELFGTVLGGWLLAKSAAAAERLLSEGTADEDFLRAKIDTARFYAANLLPIADGLAPMVTSGAGVVMAVATR